MEEYELLLNKNYPMHTIYRVEFVLGRSSLHDTKRYELVGSIELLKSEWVVKSHANFWDEESEMVFESEDLLSKFGTEREAIEFAKRHWGIK